MEISTLYEMCLRKVAINLSNGIYKPCLENPFSSVPTSIVNGIASSILEQQSSEEFTADDFEQLLTCGNLTKLEISVTTIQTSNALLREALKVLNFLRTGCQKLETFHLSLYTRNPLEIEIYEVSVAFIEPDVLGQRLRWEISEALENVIRGTPNLEDFHCCLTFDLKALRSCQKLRRLRLHFNPGQRWYDFLEEDNGDLKAHGFLQYFTVCGIIESFGIPSYDVAIILQNCPNLTSLGLMETSEALSQLYRRDKSCLKLRSCYWESLIHDRIEYSTQIRDAVMKCPMIEELEFEGCCLSVPHLKDLKNLIYLKIHLDDNVSDIVFNDLLRKIGHQLKHLYFHTNTSMDISLLLQNCLNLESLRIDVDGLKVFTNPSVSLLKLQHLTLDRLSGNVKEIFYLLKNCDELTELSLFNGRNFDDETLNSFLSRNSLSKLKVAYFESCELSQHGFREFLRNTPNLEKASISSKNIPRNDFERVISEINHDVMCIERIELKENEFFEKKRSDC